MVTSTLTSYSISNNWYCVHSLAGNSGFHNTTCPSQRTEIQLCISIQCLCTYSWTIGCLC